MHVFARVISKEPLIIFGGTGSGMMGPARILADGHVGRVYIINTFWQFLDEEHIRNLSLELSDYQLQYPERRFLYLANDYWQLEVLGKHEIPAILGNHNIFVSEEIYQVSNDSHLREYDSIYNARMSDWKRHYLCKDIESIALIYYFNPSGDFSWYGKVKEELPRALFLNGDPFKGEYRHFTKEECASAYNRARVGLCLSEKEGAMFSSVEYLLCGIPVVTTPNIGGRNHFFRPEYACIADPNPKSVSDAVKKMAAKHLSPTEIRAHVLRIINAERGTFLTGVQQFLDQHGENVNFEELFAGRFLDKMYEVFDSEQALLASL